MTVAPTPVRRYTLAEYLVLEESSEVMHEFHDGEILAMSGTSPEHALITANVTSALHARLQGKPCRVYSSNLSVAVIATHRAVHPDASVTCGPIEFHPDDTSRQVVINPRVVVEVLSPTTEAYDRGDKFEQYRELASLQEYVLVSQSAARVETYFRQPDNSWRFTPCVGLGAIAVFRSIEVDVPISEFYSGVAFPRSGAERAELP